uniref:UDENN FLCN/SMCR8-type domain-containing protein n=1 Tax=Syphacia muris TaxID=451379 RepID=A0A0N5B0Z1_9BILA
MGNLHNTALSPLSSIAPCEYDKFIRHLKKYRETFINFENNDERGTLFCTNRPILRLSTFGSPKLFNDNSLLRILSNEFCDKEKSLTLIVSNLNHILSTVFSGERFVVCASEQRMATGEDLLRKLALLCVELQPTKYIWNSNLESAPKDCQIYGQTLPFEGCNKNIAEFESAFLDLNTQRLKAKEYIGKAFASVSKKRPSMFPSDRCLIAYIVALLTDFCAIVYLSKYKSPQKVANMLLLGNGDIRILVNLLTEIDLLKYGRLKSDLSKCNTQMKIFKL